MAGPNLFVLRIQVCLAVVCEDAATVASLLPIVPVLVAVLEAHVDTVGVVGPALGCLGSLAGVPGGPGCIVGHLPAVLDALAAHEDLEV